MRKTFIILATILTVFSCRKDEKIPKADDANNLIKPYIKKYIQPGNKPPYVGDFYIHVIFKNSVTSEKNEYSFNATDQMMNIYNSVDIGYGIESQRVTFDDETKMETIQISFNYNKISDSTFYFCNADYYFSDPTYQIAGANIEFSRPTLINHETFYYYYGINSEKYYFNITYIGNNRINGVFQTQWHECCGEKTIFDVSGDFSIPDMRLYK